MPYKTRSIWFCVFGLMVVGKRSSQECGNTLGKGIVLCALPVEDETVKPFDFSLCSHGVLITSFACSGDRCKIKNPSGVQKAIRWALPYLPTDLGIRLDFYDLNDFLFGKSGSKSRRTNTINELVNFMENNQLTFVQTGGANQLMGASTKDQAIYFGFAKELAEKLHDRNCYLGQDIEQGTNELIINFNVTALAEFADWFTITTDRFPVEGFMEPITPLKAYDGNSSGTTEYWVKNFLKLIKPECLIVELGPRLTKFRALESAVEPGPGSFAEVTDISGRTDVSTVCYNLHYLLNDCREYWNEESETPWAVCGDDLYTYDNPNSLALKTELLQQFNVSGVLIWCEDIYPGNLCNNADLFANLRAVQRIRQGSSTNSENRTGTETAKT